MFADRKTSYKLPPTTITDKLVSQETRRNKALEEQKRRRAQKFDSSRQLDLFADLHLGPSDDEEHNASPSTETTEVDVNSLAPYVSMLNASPSSALPVHPHEPTSHDINAPRDVKRKPKKRRKAKGSKPNKWADKCMYAELLEMTAEDPWSSLDGSTSDGLPTDLESGWVAVAPVPAGKRCLAVTHQSSGVVGAVPNTTLRSRLLGKILIPRFPSTLPALTILDCILDSNWRDNGILHVLDVVKWKGQDVGDCETPFRLWWRDTRLAELTQTLPPSTSIPGATPTTSDPTTQPNAPQPTSDASQYHFPYPTTFLPVPYHTDTTLPTLFTQVIPSARSSRSVPVNIPIYPPRDPSAPEGTMDIDTSEPRSQSHHTPLSLVSVPAHVAADGLLLYVAESSYEAGTSPLSSWIPIVGYSEQRAVEPVQPSHVPAEGPLDLFQRLVKRRLERRLQGSVFTEGSMDIEM